MLSLNSYNLNVSYKLNTSLFMLITVLNVFHFYIHRGISSTVRRCIEKETGKEFAAKIIDLGATTESGETNPYHMLEATRQEISILRQVMGHPYISKSTK